MNPFARLITTTLGLLMAFAFIGCQSPLPTVQIETIADPEATYAAPAEQSVAVFLLRGRPDAEAESAEAKPVPREELRLEERRLINTVERGFTDAGFRIASPDEADLIAYCAEATITGEYDTYRRVPTYETYHGTINTRRGFRTHRVSGWSDTIVPERRSFVDRAIEIAVHTNVQDVDPMQVDPGGPSSIWVGRIRGRKDTVDADLSGHVRELLSRWGQSEKWRHALRRE